ncbi:hypothetical protein [uncultured Aquimarina sp.]|uniref:hypothetical protein n=1 Tax=uncultured Aquimarina sp. TaxID=575652 RepID=UPI00262D8809|nr:hypothetical protein [uncultured Aquimarina sp.]
MKKIALLLVAAVFVIGMQSCSTEENVLEEEVQQTQEENLSKFNFTPHCNFFVRYPVDWTQQDRDDFHTWARENMFSSILVLFEDGCYEVDEWRVPCNELYGIIIKNDKENNATDAVAEMDDDDDDGFPTIKYSLIAKNGYYETCADVPLHGQL